MSCQYVFDLSCLYSFITLDFRFSKQVAYGLPYITALKKSRVCVYAF